MMMISSLAPALANQISVLREAIKAGGTSTRTVADLEIELQIKLDLLKDLLAAAVPVKRNARQRKG